MRKDKQNEINLSSEFANIKTNQDKHLGNRCGWGIRYGRVLLLNTGGIFSVIFLEPCGAAINTVIRLIIALDEGVAGKECALFSL